MLEANPWLAGRLVQHKRVVCLEWHEAPAAEALAAAAAVALHAPPGGCGLRYGCTYQQLHSAIVDTPLEVPIALKLVNKDAPLFRLSVVPDCNSDGKAAFALVVTVSHAVVDGRAFYEIHNMLSEARTSTRSIRRGPTTRQSTQRTGKRLGAARCTSNCTSSSFIYFSATSRLACV